MHTTAAPSNTRTKRLLRGYAPLVALAIFFSLMAAFVPTVDIEDVSAGAGPDSGASSGTSGQPVAGDGAGAAPGQPGPAGGPGGDAGGATPVGDPGAAPATPSGTGGIPAETGGCPDRDVQVPGDPYSPPCIAFEGDNGGATSRGVTATDIVLSARILDEKGFQQTLAVLAGAEITDQPEDIKRTISALAEYFNSRFQFYGRKLKVAFYDGKGSSTTELLGGGQAEAEADAVTVAEEIQAFAELNGATAPFTDALARRQVIAFGTPYLSREWHVDRRPYNWSPATDCSIIVESVGEFANKQLANRPASFAGDGLKDKPRTFAALSPENPWYQQCVDAGQKIAQQAGNDFDTRIAYKLDINTMSNQAASVIAKLKDEGITTVLCGCDPIFPVFLTAKAAEQGYNPEWVIAGTALTDIDIVGQLYDQDQWSRAFGVSYLGAFRPIRAGLGYAAYKTVRDDEPAFAVETIYAEMAMLAIGLQLAGPNLTPQTFEQGMFSFGGGTGPFGTWGFDPDSYTPTQDYRIIWWNPNGTSPMNNKQGTYVESYDGRRFKPGELPEIGPNEQPPVLR